MNVNSTKTIRKFSSFPSIENRPLKKTTSFSGSVLSSIMNFFKSSPIGGDQNKEDTKMEVTDLIDQQPINSEADEENEISTTYEDEKMPNLEIENFVTCPRSVENTPIESPKFDEFVDQDPNLENFDMPKFVIENSEMPELENSETPKLAMENSLLQIQEMAEVSSVTQHLDDFFAEIGKFNSSNQSQIDDEKLIFGGIENVESSDEVGKGEPSVDENADQKSIIAIPIDDQKSIVVISGGDQWMIGNSVAKPVADWANLDKGILKSVLRNVSICDLYFLRFICRNWNAVVGEYQRSLTVLHWRQLVHYPKIDKYVQYQARLCSNCLIGAIYHMPKMKILDFRIDQAYVQRVYAHDQRKFCNMIEHYSPGIKEVYISNRNDLAWLYDFIYYRAPPSIKTTIFNQ